MTWYPLHICVPTMEVDDLTIPAPALTSRSGRIPLVNKKHNRWVSRVKAAGPNVLVVRDAGLQLKMLSLPVGKE